MKRAVVLLAVLYSACSGRDEVPRPTPLSQSAQIRPGYVWVLAVDASGPCVAGATAEVITGQRRGEILVANTPCDAWSDSGGFFWHDLALEQTMTIRVSASSRVATELTLTPQGPMFTATVIELVQAP